MGRTTGPEGQCDYGGEALPARSRVYDLSDVVGLLISTLKLEPIWRFFEYQSLGVRICGLWGGL